MTSTKYALDVSWTSPGPREMANPQAGAVTTAQSEIVAGLLDSQHQGLGVMRKASPGRGMLEATRGIHPLA